MGFFPTGRQHYLEPLPLRRPTFIDRPLFFSEECDRGHRPSSFDISLISNISAPKLPREIWKALLEEFDRVVPSESALMGSAPLGPDAWGTPHYTPILLRLADNPVKPWHSERPRDEFGFIDISPLGEDEEEKPLLSSSCVSPLEEYEGSATSSLIYEYEFSPAPFTTRSDIGLPLSSFLLPYEHRFPPATAPVARCAITTHPDTPGSWKQRELSPFSVSSSSDVESLGIHRADSPESPWEEEFVPLAIDVSDDMSTIGHAAITPRLFLEEFSLPNSATGEYQYSRSSDFTPPGYGTFAMRMPLTPRSPAWSDYSESDIFVLLHDNVMNEYPDDEDFHVWDEMCLCIGALMFFTAASTFTFVLLAILMYSAGI